MRRIAAVAVGALLAAGMTFAGATAAHAITIIKVDRPEPKLVRIYAVGASYASISNGTFYADCGPTYGTYGSCFRALDAIGIPVPENMARGKYTVTVRTYDGLDGASTYTYIDGPPPPPVDVKPPVVSTVSPHVGDTLTASTGQWSNSPTGFEFRWRHCKNNVCTRVAIAPSYTVTASDVGYRIEVRVFASNAQGTGTATSKRTDFVVP